MMHVLSSGRQVAAGILLVGTQISNGGLSPGHASTKVGDGVFERFPAILLLLPGEFVLANGRLPLTVARQIKLQFLGSSIKFGKAVFDGCQLLAAFLQLLAVLLQHTLKDSLLEVLVARIYLRLHPLQVLLEFLKRCCGACIGRCCGQ